MRNELWVTVCVDPPYRGMVSGGSPQAAERMAIYADLATAERHAKASKIGVMVVPCVVTFDMPAARAGGAK